MRNSNCLYFFLGIAVVAIAFGIISFTMGCSMLQVKTESGPCYQVAPEDSKICEVVPALRDVSFVLQIANLEALKRDVYKAEQALDVIDSLIAVLNGSDSINYAKFFELVGLKVDPVLFVLVQEYTAEFSTITIPIKPYDKELLLIHLNKQRRVVLMAMEAYHAKNEGPIRFDGFVSSGTVVTGTNPGGTNGGLIAHGSGSFMFPETLCKGGAGPYRPCEDEASILLASGGAGY